MNGGILEHLRKRGPDRVLVDAEGLAMNATRAMAEHNVTAQFIFIRGDGWTLGAPRHLAATAYALWVDKWVGWTDQTCRELRPMSDEKWR